MQTVLCSNNFIVHACALFFINIYAILKTTLTWLYQIWLHSGPALGVGRVGSRLGPQDLGGPQMPKIGPQLVAIKRSRYSNRTVTTLIEQPIIQSIVEHWSLPRVFCCGVRVGILLMTLIGVEWLQDVAVTFFFFFLVFTLTCAWAS